MLRNATKLDPPLDHPDIYIIWKHGPTQTSAPGGHQSHGMRGS